MKRVAVVLAALLLITIPANAMAPELPVSLGIDGFAPEVIEEVGLPANDDSTDAPGSSPEPPVEDSSAKPVRPSTAVAPSSAPRISLGDIVDLIARQQGISPTDPAAPDGLKGLARLVDQPNGTSGTPLEGNHTGHHSHTHGQAGDLGLGPVWGTPFYGTPAVTTSMDVDGDGIDDALVGTDSAIIAVSGDDGRIIWAHLIGNEISALFAVDHDGDGVEDVGFATYWQAQSPRVGVLSKHNGEAIWNTIGDAAFIGAAPTDDGDIIAIDITGIHYKYGGRTGAEMWRHDTEVLDDEDPVLGLVYFDYGHYLRTFADLNGDGVTDSISAGLYRINGLVAMDNTYTIIHAVDGASGAKLWMHPVGAEPPVLGIAQTVLSDLGNLDVHGDDSWDVSYTGWSFRWPLLWLILVPTVGLGALAFIHYETYVRAVDGSSDTLAEPLGGRTLFMPVLDALESYHHVGRADLDGDGRHELAVIRNDIATTLLEGAESQLEFYRLPESAANGPTDLYLSPVTRHYNATGVIADSNDAGLAVLVPHFAGGQIQVLAPDGALVADSWSDEVPLAASIGEDLIVGKNGFVEIRQPDSEVAQVESRIRSNPQMFASGDFDGDGIPDLWTLGTGGDIHIVDGVNGNFLNTIDFPAPIQNFWLQNITGDQTAELALVRAGGIDTEFTLESWSVAPLNRLWSTPATGSDPVAFDSNGDGVLDFAARVDTLADTVAVIDGTTGAQRVIMALSFFVDPDVVVPIQFPGRTHEDLGVFDRYGDFDVFDGKSGDLMFDDNSLPTLENACIGGGSALNIVYDDFTGIKISSYDKDGDFEVTLLMPDAELLSCAVSSVGADSVIFIAYELADERAAQIMRWDGDVVWGHERTFFSEAAPLRFIGALEDGANRLYHSQEDHVLARKWSDGSEIGQFVANGPLIESGTIVDLDGDGHSEVVALAGDGMLWALSEDADATTAVLAEKATELGKQPVNEVLPQQSPTKGSPGLGLLAILGALAVGLIIQRRKP